MNLKKRCHRCPSKLKKIRISATETLTVPAVAGICAIIGTRNCARTAIPATTTVLMMYTK
jgi:hypothetical protein